MKHLMLAVLLLIATGTHAQLSLRGSVLSETKEPVANATVILKSKATSVTTTSAADGSFSFTGLEKGSYTASVSSAGFETFEESFNLDTKSASSVFQVTMIPKFTDLQTLEVVGRTARRYNSDYSFSATKTAALIKDIPQSISSVTKELIADRQAFQLADAVKIVSGVIPSSFYNQYAIRGISQNEEGQIINGMRTRQFYFLQPLTTNIERVEVIKGPASATFASVDPGGSINMVTKKPLAVDRREVSFSVGSFSTIRGTIDFTGPLNKEKTLLYRLNGAYQENASFRDLVKQKALLVSPSFTYLPSNKTAINAEVIFSNMNGVLDRGQPIFGAQAGVTSLNSTPISLNLGAPNDQFKSREFIATGSLSHKFTNQISFNASYMKQTWTEDLREHRTTNAFAPDINNQPIRSLAAMQFVQRQQFWNIDNVNAYFNFDVKTGAVKHQLLVGYDLHSWEKTKGGGQNAARGFLLTNGNVANSFVPANAANYQTINVGGVVMPRPNVPHFDLNNPTYTIRNLNDYVMNVRTALPAALTTTNAVYIQEMMQWKKFTLLLSLRQEWFRDITNYESPNERSFTNTALLPRIGLTYAVTSNINVYATYLEGFQPQSNTVTLMPQTGAFFNTPRSAALFEPLRSDLKEIGAKASVWKNKLSITASVYEINQKNILMNADIPAFPDSLVTRGADRSRGFEVDIAGFIMPNWQVNASYSYIDARIVADRNKDLIGARKENTPYNSFNVWTRYNFLQSSFLKDLGIGLGVQHNGDRIPWFTRAFKVPAYTLLDMAIYYTPSKSNLQLSLNVNNVFNTTHWVGAQSYLRLFPGAPRNAMLTATYRF